MPISSTPGRTRTTTERRARTHALAGGLLYLLTFASSFPAAALLRSMLDDPGFVLGRGSSASVLAACALDLVNALAAIGTAVALYPVIRRWTPTSAIGFVTSRSFEAAVISIGVMSLLGVVTLRSEVGAATDPDTLVTVARSMVAVRDWTFLIGPGLMASFNAVLLGTALYRSRLVPRAIPVLGLVGAPMLLLNTAATFLNGNEAVLPWAVLGVAPIFLWELSLGLWLTFKGFSRPLSGLDPIEPLAAPAPAPVPPIRRDSAVGVA